MKHLSNYNKFISEKYQLDANDDPEIASQKKSFNDLEENITEYNLKKVNLDNIYKTYTDDKDLINKLKDQKLIEVDNSNTKTIKFTNPLLAIHAQISRKMRKIMDIEKLIKTDQQTITNKKDASKGNKDLMDNLKQEIKEIEEKIASKKTEIQKLNSEIIILKKQIDSEIAKIKKQLIDSQRRINKEQST
jgi:predicted  nucleic acid-binding Zn-ribbon protein